MRETPAEAAWLQSLIDETFDRAGPHFLSIAEPGRRLDARQVISYMQGMKHIAFATVSSAGAPLVSPLDAFFIHGRFHAGTSAGAARARHIRRNPAVSLSHFVGDDVGITVHGTASIHRKGDAVADVYDEVATAWYGGSPFDLGDVVILRVEPRKMWTFAGRPQDYPA